MGRSISATLQTATENMGSPYIYLLFTSADAGTTYDYSSDQEGRRILQLEHHEEAYNDYATIVLRNEDRAIPDLRGYWTEIGYGYVASGNEYAQTPRLWVKSQQTVSMEGVLVDILMLEGMWSKLREIIYRVGDPPFYQIDYTTDTVLTIITAVLTELGMTLNAIGDQSDGIIDVYTPNFSINERPFEYGASLLYRLIRMTMCYLRPKTGLAWEIRYPQATDTADESYYNDQKPYFFEYTEKKNCLVPNHIIVFANMDEDGTWANIITGEAEDATEIARLYETIRLHIAGNITTQADATTRAEVILARVKGEQLGGRALIPHDCRVELHDKVAFYDSR